tara:strand:- start:58 stop:240 length:183 start_codon:yes stop_codon:yes gene_type:complete
MSRALHSREVYLRIQKHFSQNNIIVVIITISFMIIYWKAAKENNVNEEIWRLLLVETITI